MPKQFSIQIDVVKTSKPVRTSEQITQQIVKETPDGAKVAEVSSIRPVNQGAANIGTVSVTKSNLSSHNNDEESQILSCENSSAVPQANNAAISNNNNHINSNQMKKNLREKRVKFESQNYYDYESVSTNNGASHNTSAGNSTNNNAVTKFLKKANEEMKNCMKILNKLKNHQCAGPFLEPVDPVVQQCENYFDIVKQPIDLSLVQRHLVQGLYLTSTQFFADIKKIWSNSYLYNQKGSTIYQLTMDMDKYFKQLIQEFEGATYGSSTQNSASKGVDHPSMVQLQKQVDLLTEQIKEFHTTQKGGKGSGAGGSHKGKPLPYKSSELPMTLQEKRILGQHIRSLPAFFLKGVWEIVKEANMGTQGGEQLEFDINQLPNDVARQLDFYVKEKIAQLNQQKNQQPTNTFTQNTDTTTTTSTQDSIPSTLNIQEFQGQNYALQPTYNSPKDDTTQYNNNDYNYGVKNTAASALSDTDEYDNDSESSLITDSGDMAL